MSEGLANKAFIPKGFSITQKESEYVVTEFAVYAYRLPEKSDELIDYRIRYNSIGKAICFVSKTKDGKKWAVVQYSDGSLSYVDVDEIRILKKKVEHQE